MEEENIDIGIICTTKDSAQEVADKLCFAGIKGIWNFSHYDFSNELPDIAIENVHLGDSLTILSYKVKRDSEQ